MIEWIAAYSALILAVTALRYLLRSRLSLRPQYAMWTPVLIRLLAPFSFGRSVLSAAGAAQKLPQAQTVQSVSGYTRLEYAGGRRSLRERITLLMKKPRTKTCAAAVIAAALAFASGCAYTGAAEKTAAPDETVSGAILENYKSAFPRSDGDFICEAHKTIYTEKTEEGGSRVYAKLYCALFRDDGDDTPDAGTSGLAAITLDKSNTAVDFWTPADGADWDADIQQNCPAPVRNYIYSHSGETGGDTADMESSVRRQAREHFGLAGGAALARWDAQEVPDAVKNYALSYVGGELGRYREQLGIAISDAKIIAAAEIPNGTSDGARSVRTWLLEYRLKPEDAEKAAPEHAVMEDGWITETDGRGQPVLFVCDSRAVGAYLPIKVGYTGDIGTGSAAFTRAAEAAYSDYIGALAALGETGAGAGAPSGAAEYAGELGALIFAEKRAAFPDLRISKWRLDYLRHACTLPAGMIGSQAADFYAMNVSCYAQAPEALRGGDGLTAADGNWIVPSSRGSWYISDSGGSIVCFYDNLHTPGTDEFAAAAMKAARSARQNAAVSADFASQALLSRQGGYDEFIDEQSQYQVKIAFTARETVTDFRFLSIISDFGDNSEPRFRLGAERYVQPRLSPGRPLVIGLVFAGDMPTFAISYKAPDGSERYYAVNTSGLDGSVILFGLREENGCLFLT